MNLQTAIPLVLCVAFVVVLGSANPVAGQNGEDCVSVETGAVECIIPIPEDTLFYIDNRGVSRIFVDLNGHRFKLASDPDEVAASANAFPIPLHGELTIDISEYMLPGFDTNVIRLLTQGPADTDWQFVIAPEYVEGQTGVAYAITGLEPFPTRSRLTQNYPNPFRSSTTLVFEIAEDRLTGVPLRLDVFDVRGRLVRQLIDETRFPGSFAVQWDGRDDADRPVPAGLYVARLVGTDVQQAVRMVRIR